MTRSIRFAVDIDDLVANPQACPVGGQPLQDPCRKGLACELPRIGADAHVRDHAVGKYLLEPRPQRTGENIEQLVIGLITRRILFRMRGAELAEHPVDEASTILAIPCSRDLRPIPFPHLLPIETMESLVVKSVVNRLPHLLEDLQPRELRRLCRPRGRSSRVGLRGLRPDLDAADRQAGTDQNCAEQGSLRKPSPSERLR
jgi:hypothetical protein